MAITLNTSNRITGVASGIDTDEVVKALLMSYQARVDKQTQLTTKMQWKADAYRQINTLIKNFRAKYLSALSSSNMMTTSAYRSMTVRMDESVNAVSISASSTAVAGTYTINEITELAAAPKVSSQQVFTGEKYDSEVTLENLELQNAFQFDENGELSFSINDKVFTFNKDTTIAEMMRTVNNAGIGVTMRFSSLTKGFSLTSAVTGSQSTIDIVNISGNAFSAVDSALGIAEGTYAGKDAECVIEGVQVRQSSNTFTFDGVTYTLKAKSGEVKFTVEQDYQSTVDRVKEFVKAYNELIDELQEKVKEEIHYDYPPLTEAQKEEMDEDEIKEWEEKAKSGVLRNDAYISSLLTSLRSAFYTKVEGTGLSLAEIGLTTGDYKNGAKIEVDEQKLLNAIKKDPEAVEKMFVQTSDTSSGKGVIVRISDALLNYTKETSNVALESLEKKISASEDKEDELEARMREKEESLWRKFSEMEAALARLNSMSNWLSSLLMY